MPVKKISKVEVPLDGVYRIFDPKGEADYIGSTTKSPVERLVSHFAQALRKKKDGTWYHNHRLQEWLRELLQLGLVFKIRIEPLEKNIPLEKLKNAEMRWIKNFLNRGISLRNAVELRDGVLIDSLETRTKKSATHRGEKHPMYGKKHLPETRAEISAAAYEQWRRARMIGERGPTAKLTAAKVKEIRRLRKQGGITLRELAERYNIHQTQISRIVRRERWEWLK